VLYTLWSIVSVLRDAVKALRRINLLLDDILVAEKRQVELLVEISKAVSVPEGTAVELRLSAEPPIEQP
jgi:hypothetical protein